MLGWEEIGQGVGGRFKSVIILALAALLLAQQGYFHEREMISTGIETVMQSNPIDSCFSSLSIAALSPEQARICAQVYLDCWEKELENAYTVLVGRDCFPGMDNYVEEASRNFAAFAEAESWLEAYCNVERTEGELATDKAYLQGQLYRHLVLRIHKEQGIVGEKPYIFDRNETEKVLREFGLIGK